MSVNTSITGAVIGLVLVTILIGMVLGMALGGTELFNPHTSRAVAGQIEMETAVQTQRENIDLEIYEQEQAALLAYRQAQREQELAHQAELQALGLELARVRGTALTVAGCAAVVLSGGGVAVYLFSLVRRNRDLAIQQREIDNLRTRNRDLARANERLIRSSVPKYSPFILEGNVDGGNGKQQAPIQN